ncbi:hypothetical protein KZ779_30015 [Escherichia coli]|nr:hypothetical protein [Escherichia coli]
MSSNCSSQYPVPTADVVYDTPVVIFFHLVHTPVSRYPEADNNKKATS